MLMTLIGLMAMTLPLQAQQGSESERIDVIWGAANNRIAQQADVWFQDGEFPMCVQLLCFQAELNPHDYDIVTNLGWMYENIERPADAEVIYTDYQKNNPKDPDGALPIAQYWFLHKKYDKVVAILAGHLPPKTHPNNYRMLALSFEKVDRLEESAATWKQLIKLYPDQPASQMNLDRVNKKIAEKK
ncbi:hypothetical protein BH11ARM1_BH11ARM1_12480 [soil metagenome]